MGSELIDEVVRLSGLPPQLIKKELTDIMKKEGIKPEMVTETVLRRVLAKYLRDVLTKVSPDQ
jgi:hypothetical protein